MTRARLEISDVIVDHDPKRGRRRVKKRDALSALGPWGRRVVNKIPSDPEGYLDDDAVDHLLVDAHRELQRLNEEFQQGARLLRVLRAMVAASGRRRPRVVDVGCGIGFLPRWLASEGAIDAELIGCDFNPALIDEARCAAAAEDLAVRFEVADAFTMKTPAHVFTSTGVLHHFRGDDLSRFFAMQKGALGFIHYDIERSFVSPIGSTMFHLARMRIPLAQHDGILSAARAHSAEVLVDAARAALPDFTVGIFNKFRGLFPITRVMRPVVGVRRALESDFVRALGKDARKWRR